MSKATVVLASALAALAAGCGGGDSTGPKTNLSGNWIYSASNLSAGGSLTCNVSGVGVSITQSGSTFSGSYNGGTISCTDPSGTYGGAIGSGTVVNGALSGNSVSFDLDTSDWHDTGSVNGSSMSGTVVIHLVVNGSAVIVSGSWGAARQ